MKNSIIKASIIVFSFSLVAKLIGFVKSVVQAAFFGTSLEMDAFNVANGFVSNVLFMLTSAISVAFIPMYIQHSRENNGRKIFASKAFTFLGLICVVLSLLLWFMSPLITKIIAPSFDDYGRLLTKRYFNVLIIGVVFSFLANMYTSVLNAEKKYAYSSLSSVVNSIVLISFIIIFSRRLGIWTLVISVPISFALQWVVLFFIGNRFATISFNRVFDKSLIPLFFQATPILLCQATVEINQVIDRALLTSVASGALTAVSYSAILYQFATTLITAPLSTVMFTELSEAGAECDSKRIEVLLYENSYTILLVCIPVVLVIYFCGYDIVKLVYGHGKFDNNAVMQCSQGLRLYGLCLLPVCTKTIISRAYYSLSDTKRPMVIGVFEVLLNIILSVLLAKPFGIIGIVGATTISSYVFIIVIILDFNKSHVSFISIQRMLSSWKLLIASFSSALVIILMRSKISYNPFTNVVLTSLLCFGIYIFTLCMLRERSVISITKKILKKKIGGAE